MAGIHGAQRLGDDKTHSHAAAREAAGLRDEPLPPSNRWLKSMRASMSLSSRSIRAPKAATRGSACPFVVGGKGVGCKNKSARNDRVI